MWGTTCNGIFWHWVLHVGPCKILYFLEDWQGPFQVHDSDPQSGSHVPKTLVVCPSRWVNFGPTRALQCKMSVLVEGPLNGWGRVFIVYLLPLSPFVPVFAFAPCCCALTCVFCPCSPDCYKSFRGVAGQTRLFLVLMWGGRALSLAHPTMPWYWLVTSSGRDYHLELPMYLLGHMW